MTVLYLGVRYLGILLAALIMLSSVPTISLTDTGCFIMYVIQSWTDFLVFAMLLVIIITWLYAMHQRSRKILIFLIVAFLADSIFDGVVGVMMTLHVSGEELILSGIYQCSIDYTEDVSLMASVTWILITVSDVLALCLAVWTTIKHSRELRRHSAGGIIEDRFTVLMKIHVVYFASVVAVSCFRLIAFSPTFSTAEYSLGIQLYVGFFQILDVVQLCMLGPRLILGIREFHAKLMTDSDAASSMTSIAFQEHVHMTGSSV